MSETKPSLLDVLREVDADLSKLTRRVAEAIANDTQIMEHVRKIDERLSPLNAASTVIFNAIRSREAIFYALQAFGLTPLSEQSP